MNYQLKDYENVIRSVLDSGGEFQIYPRGTSMLPLLRQGRDWVTVIRPKKDLKARDIILYKRKNGAYVLHRILDLSPDGYVLCGDNQDYMENGVQQDQIIGVVNGFGINGRRYSTDSRSMRVYEMLWCLMPLRKLYFRMFGHRYPEIRKKKDKKEV